MSKIDIDKFVCSLRRRFGEDKGIATRLDSCLRDQGLKFIDTPDGGRLEKQGEQKPADWSEKDNQYLCGLIGLIEQSKAGLPITLKGKAADNCIDWLKSLSPQKQWKPSDEQMLAINTAINVLGKGTINGKYLIELQEQLKKLRENKV